MASSIENIFPLIVPVDYVQGGWRLPHYTFQNTSFILSWVTFNSDSAMTYLTKDQIEDLNSKNQNWQQKAFENLRHSITDTENFFTHFKISDDNKRLIFIAFIHSDGIGSSRILLSNELKKAFPDGYYVALPDRSCGLIISKNISVQELKETKELVRSMRQTATIPMSESVHPNNDFVLPELWTQPIDVRFSDLLVDEIKKLVEQ